MNKTLLNDSQHGVRAIIGNESQDEKRKLHYSTVYDLAIVQAEAQKMSEVETLAFLSAELIKAGFQKEGRLAAQLPDLAAVAMRSEYTLKELRQMPESKRNSLISKHLRNENN